MGRITGQELTRQNEILEIGNAPGVPGPQLSVLQYFPKLFGSIKYDSHFASSLYFWKTTCIFKQIQFGICLSFNSLNCYFVGKQSDSFGNFLKAFVVGIRSKSCLFLSESIQSELENYGNYLNQGFSKWSPEQHRHYHLGTGPSHSEGPHVWFNAVTILSS